MRARSDRSAAVRFPARLAAHVRQNRLLRPGERVLVAVSGGIDSVALLHILRFGEPLPLELHAAHFDHRMREDSGRDAAWVAGLCRAWEVPLDARAAATPPRGEAAARELRHAFLAVAAERAGATRILTAHHADDQAETVLLRLLRGTGVHGLAGIPARRDRFVRPLLPFRRAEIAAYADAVRLRWREDPTNVGLAYARNRVRHVLLPALERVRPDAAELLAAIATDAAETNGVLQGVAERVSARTVEQHEQGSLVLARDLLLRYPVAVRARVLRTALRRLGSAPGRSGTRAALEFITSGAGGGVIELAGGVRLERSFDRLLLRRAAEPVPADRPVVIAVPEDGRGEALIGGMRFAVHWSRSTPDGDGDAAVFDPTALRFPLELRGWRPGDRIRLDYGSKKLKKLFVERRIARGTRSRIPVLAEGGGRGDRIVWVVGHARAAVARPAETGARFYIRVKDAEHG